jgi:hypothetical protein
LNSFLSLFFPHGLNLKVVNRRADCVTNIYLFERLTQSETFVINGLVCATARARENSKQACNDRVIFQHSGHFLLFLGGKTHSSSLLANMSVTAGHKMSQYYGK